MSLNIIPSFGKFGIVLILLFISFHVSLPEINTKGYIIQTWLFFIPISIFQELGEEPPHNLTVNTWLQNEYMTTSAVDSQQPSPVQQNVPAWALFGMFFIVIPLSSVMIHERKSSVMNRLKTTPMKIYSFLLAKLTTYVIINMLQLLLMFVVGIYVLPHLGILPMAINGKIISIIIIGLFASLAAKSLATLVNLACNSLSRSPRPLPQPNSHLYYLSVFPQKSTLLQRIKTKAHSAS